MLCRAGSGSAGRFLQEADKVLDGNYQFAQIGSAATRGAGKLVVDHQAQGRNQVALQRAAGDSLSGLRLSKAADSARARARLQRLPAAAAGDCGSTIFERARAPAPG